MKDMKIYTVGITGASGVIYGVRVVEELLKTGNIVHLVITDAGWQVLGHEMKWNIEDRELFLKEHFSMFSSQLHYHDIYDFKAPIASGSYQTDSMIVVPCTMGTLSGISQGASGNLLERAADVILKEGKELIVVPRETPLNSIHLKNMLTLSNMGVKILPAMPGFYFQPENLDDIINHLVGKILDSVGISHRLFKRWGE